MKKKVITLTLSFGLLVSSCVFAASTSGVFQYSNAGIQANGYLNTINTSTAEASTVKVGGSNSYNLYVGLYAKNTNGTTLNQGYASYSNSSVYVGRLYAAGDQFSPLSYWASQHSTMHPKDGINHLVLYQ